MNRHERDRYYQHFGNENRQDFNRYDRQGRDLTPQFERKYQRHHQDGDRSDFKRTRYSSDRDNYQSYRRRDYDMKRNYNDNTRGRQGDLGNIRQGYGIPSFGGTSGGYNPAENMQRERSDQQQGYGSGRMSGYSGSRFGGSHYSAHGGFGGSERYGSMSGGGGNIDDYVSASGYGGGGSPTHSDRGVPDHSMRNLGSGYDAGRSNGSTYSDRNQGGGKDYGNGNNSSSHGSSNRNNIGRYSSDSDRGGYVNRDPNY